MIHGRPKMTSCGQAEYWEKHQLGKREQQIENERVWLLMEQQVLKEKDLSPRNNFKDRKV
jgi:hypothetical protein